MSLATVEVTRGLAPISPPRRDPDEDAIAAMTLGGRVVLFDTSDYMLDGTVLAVVTRHDGSIGLEYAKKAHDRSPGYLGHRVGFYPVKPKDPRTVREMHACTIIGRVISQG